MVSFGNNLLLAEKNKPIRLSTLVFLGRTSYRRGYALGAYTVNFRGHPLYYLIFLNLLPITTIIHCKVIFPGGHVSLLTNPIEHPWIEVLIKRGVYRKKFFPMSYKQFENWFWTTQKKILGCIIHFASGSSPFWLLLNLKGWFKHCPLFTSCLILYIVYCYI